MAWNPTCCMAPVPLRLLTEPEKVRAVDEAPFLTRKKKNHPNASCAWYRFQGSPSRAIKERRKGGDKRGDRRVQNKVTWGVYVQQQKVQHEVDSFRINNNVSRRHEGRERFQ